jgi:hypothetical protein
MTPEEVLAKIRTRGYWWVAIRPIAFSKERIAYTDLETVVRQLQVKFGGWHFPHISENQPFDHLGDSIQQAIDWQHFLEFWRLYQSGQFLWAGGIMDDWRDQSQWWPRLANEEEHPTVGVGEILRKLTEIFEFASRFAVSKSGDVGMHVSMDLRNTAGRTLIGDNPRRFWHVVQPYTTQANAIPLSAEFESFSLGADPRRLAREWAAAVFARFGWKPPPERLTEWQQEVLAQ